MTKNARRLTIKIKRSRIDGKIYDPKDIKVKIGTKPINIDHK